jgi:hypothetical protein
MTANEQRKYCGMVQNAILDIYGVFAKATSTGQSLWIKETDYSKLKGVFPLTKIGGQYVLMVTKTIVKKMNLTTN